MKKVIIAVVGVALSLAAALIWWSRSRGGQEKASDPFGEMGTFESSRPSEKDFNVAGIGDVTFGGTNTVPKARRAAKKTK